MRSRVWLSVVSLVATFALVAGTALPARAMCTCMIRVKPPRPESFEGGAETTLKSDASLVVLMREGRRTVITMRNDYEGPPEDFALVVPVPDVLDASQVRTLPHGLVERLDRLSAPRLAEYWEQDPCGSGAIARPGGRRELRARAAAAGDGVGGAMAEGWAEPPPPPVVVEREYSVDEYDIQILSAADSTSLERWLRDHDYEVPDGASAAFAPYVARGTKFFLAKVNASRVRFEGGRARLSPLQFSYEDTELSLPIALGLLNSPGEQEVVALVIGRGQRFEAANRPNAFAPTNLELDADAADELPALYEALFRRVLAHHPGAVVTEYAENIDRDAVRAQDLGRLGVDLLPSRDASGLTLTRLHYRYSRDTAPDDLVFRPAPPVGGGDGTPATDGSLGATAPETRLTNAFRAHYAVVHRWTSATSCASPTRGRWRRPSSRAERTEATQALTKETAIDDTRLESLVEGGLARVGLGRVVPAPATVAAAQEGPKPPEIPAAQAPSPPPPAARVAEDDGFGCDVARRGHPEGALFGLLSLSLFALFRRRRRRG
jgi:hypothetical protein